MADITTPNPTEMKAPIVGSRFYEGALFRVNNFVSEHPLTLLREPNNKYDPNAIRVHDSMDDLMLGHVPAPVAAVLAPKIDGGETWTAEIAEVPPNMILRKVEDDGSVSTSESSDEGTGDAA